MINETLRMHPPATIIFPRIALVDHKIGEHEIKVGDMVTTGLMAQFFNPKYFDDPMQYKPERWLDKEN